VSSVPRIRTVLFTSAEISHPPSIKNPPAPSFYKGGSGGFRFVFSNVFLSQETPRIN
jgi:hypothetical protein